MANHVYSGLMSRVRYLAGSINDFCRVFLSPVLDRLAEGVLNGRVVTLHEVAVDELDRQGGFACRTDSAEIGPVGWH